MKIIYFWKVFSKIFSKVFAKTFVIFVTFRKLFPRKAKKNFCENTKTKIFVSTLVSIPQGAKTVKWGEGAQQGV
jgi:hypothetical protein